MVILPLDEAMLVRRHNFAGTLRDTEQIAEDERLPGLALLVELFFVQLDH
jgi:hypothetical protein